MAKSKPSATPRTSLDRDAWIDAAFAVLAKDGIAGLRVEALAKRLNVTKGSFYWHFKDRDELHRAVLEVWRAGRIRDIQKQTAAVPGEEHAQILHVIEVYSTARNRRGMTIELAVRDWARRDAGTAAVVREVDAVRIECAAQLFLARGLSVEEAHHRSVLLYSYVFGVSLLAFERGVADLAATRDWIARLIAAPTNAAGASR